MIGFKTMKSLIAFMLLSKQIPEIGLFNEIKVV